MSKKTLAFALCSLLTIANLSLGEAQARKWTVTQRQERLSSEIDTAFKANQLTLEEADSLRKECLKISSKEEKMKVKNGGRLSYADDNELEKDLNKVSNKLHKKVLDKRVQ